MRYRGGEEEWSGSRRGKGRGRGRGSRRGRGSQRGRGRARARGGWRGKGEGEIGGAEGSGRVVCGGGAGRLRARTCPPPPTLPPPPHRSPTASPSSRPCASARRRSARCPRDSPSRCAPTLLRCRSRARRSRCLRISRSWCVAASRCLSRTFASSCAAGRPPRSRANSRHCAHVKRYVCGGGGGGGGWWGGGGELGLAPTPPPSRSTLHPPPPQDSMSLVYACGVEGFRAKMGLPPKGKEMKVRARPRSTQSTQSTYHLGVEQTLALQPPRPELSNRHNSPLFTQPAFNSLPSPVS